MCLQRKGLEGALLLSFFVVSLLYVSINIKPSKSDEMSPDATLGGTNVILIGWDGVQKNHLFELLNRGSLPNLSSLIRNGVIVNATISDHCTDTKAGWTQILTGYKWWRTGVFNNYVWFNSIPDGYTIPERLENIYGKDNIVTAFIKAKVNHMETINGADTASPISPWSLYTNEAIYSNLPSELDFVSTGPPDTGVYDPNNDRFADVVGPLMVKFIQNNSNNRFFAFFHIADPDHIGHVYGEDSVEYENGIETCDYWLGRFVDELRIQNMTQNTLIYVTTDHGFDEGAYSHYNSPDIFLATNDKNVTRNGDEVDIAPTIYYGLGLWNWSFAPTLDGFPLQMTLPLIEAQKRQNVLLDTAAIPTPSLSISEESQGQKRVTFSAKDNNLAAVFLLVDNKLRSIGSWNWTRGEEITATGSYFIETSGLSPGLHTVKIFAFDEHGEYNGGVENYPAGGGTPAVNSATFDVIDSAPTSVPTVSPAQTPTVTPAPTTNSSQAPIQTPSPTPTTSPTPSASPNNSNLPMSSPSPTNQATSPPNVPTLTGTPHPTLTPSASPSNESNSGNQSGSTSSSPESVSFKETTTFQIQLTLLIMTISAVAVAVTFYLRKKDWLKKGHDSQIDQGRKVSFRYH